MTEKKTYYPGPYGAVMLLAGFFISAALMAAGLMLKGSEPGGPLRRGIWNSPSELKVMSGLKADGTYREGCVTVPVPNEISLEDVEVYNDYLTRSIRVLIPGVPGEYFKDHPFSGDTEGVVSFKYGFEGGRAVIELKTDVFLETELKKEKGNLYVRLIPPYEKYDNIVVVDAGHGGEETGSVSYGISEKDIALKVSDAIREAVSEGDYHVYFTRDADMNVSDEERLSLIENTRADLVLSLHTDMDEHTRTTHGISAYYHAGDDARLAEALLENISEETGSPVSKCSEDQDLSSLTGSDRISEIRLCLGYITNRHDAQSALSDSYARQAAQDVIKTLDSVISPEG